MKFLNHISFFLLACCLLSCSGVSNSWTNFRAHYNTYYNAEKSFKAGLKKINDQPVEVNPELPVRVHRQPRGVPEEDFDNTIEKGAQILRRFPDSKWTDDALFLIGKSYYYKGDFYLAIEKFEELQELSDNSYLKQQASIWTARSFLDLEQFDEGISYIKSNLGAPFWSPASKAEFQVLLVEHLAMQENWSEAAGYLSDALPSLEESKLKGRVFFLNGQVLERLERYGEAFFAFDNVASRFPDYEYVYWSRLKKAEVARKEGNTDLALSIYMSMAKDDKNFSRLNRIDYEIARTREMQGSIQQAEREYKEILSFEYTETSRNVRAKTYYRLGKIYSENYNDFDTAAAYFDSSSSQVTNINFLESNFNAQNLASAYGKYARLRDKVHRLDSLLWLGSLQAAELDSVLDVIREQRRVAVSEQVQNQSDAGSRLVNINSGSQIQAENVSSSAYGFMNYRNARLKQESIDRFRAVWGNRPLVDNWRRLEVVRAVGLSSNEDGEVAAGNSAGTVIEKNDSELSIDTGEIPITEEEKDAYLKELVSAKYELGNLFLISLNNPDSAESYFNNIVRNYPDSPLAPQSMYSLYEIYKETGNQDRAGHWSQRILRDFSDTRYAQKISGTLQGEEIEIEDYSEFLLFLVQDIEESTGSLSPVRAEQFRGLALANRNSEAAPFIYYQAVKTYVELAKKTTNKQLYNRYLQKRTENKGSDADSAATPVYPFYGTYWDSVRTVIEEYEATFAEKPHNKELSVLKEALETSSAPTRPESAPVKPDPAEQDKPGRIKSCRALNIAIVGGMNNFLARIYYPSELHNKELPEEITYDIVIGKNGRVHSYKPVTSETEPLVQQAFGNAIENSLLFDPTATAGNTQEVSCRITFRVK